MRVNGIDLLSFSPQQRRIIAAIASGTRTMPIVIADLIEKVYPDPDLEPENPGRTIGVQIHNIRKKWTSPNWRVSANYGRPGGYFLEATHGCD